MKVLYTFYHGAAFAWSLVHKLSVHPNDDAYLLISDGWDWCAGKPEPLKQIMSFIEAGIFKKVYIYDHRVGRDDKECNTLEKSEMAILKGIDRRLKIQKCDITSFEKIYSHTDGEDSLGIYFSLKGIKFFWFENAPNLLAMRNEEWLRTTYTQLPGYQAALRKHKTLFGKNEFQYLILYPNSRKGDFPPERCQVFDAEKAAESLSEEDKAQILRCFGLSDITCPQNAAMLLLQSDWFTCQVFFSCEFIRTRFKRYRLYMYSSIQCMLDYFLPKEAVAVIKTHPSDMLDRKTLERYFNGVFAFPSLFTVLLTKSLLPNYIPQYRILLGSTANKQLSGNVNDIYCPGVWLFSLFFHKYYAVLDVLNRIEGLYKYAGERFETIGSHGTFMDYNGSYMEIDINSLISVNFAGVQEQTQLSYTIVQIDDEELGDKISKNDFIIMTDVWREFTPDKIKSLREKAYITSIKIAKIPVKHSEDILPPLEDEYIYIMSKSPDWGKKMEGYSLKKNNEYGGFILSAEIESVNEQPGVEKSKLLYPLNTNISLLECYQKFGKHYLDEFENEIMIGGEITERALENMKEIVIKFAGAGKNKVMFKDLNTPNKYEGNFRIEALNSSRIEIGKLFFANYGILIHSADAEVVIDDDVMFANNVVVRAMNYHSIYEFDGKRLPNRNLYIGKHVWLGYGATIYAGGVIGSGSVIGSGCVVGGRIPNNCIAVGNPVRIVRKDIFWQFTGNQSDYYDLPEQLRTVDEYIARTQEDI